MLKEFVKNPSKPVAEKSAPKTILDQARILIKASRYQEAEKLLLEYLRDQPNAPDVPECYLYLGRAQANQNHIDVAHRTFKSLGLRFSETESAAQALEEQALLHAKRKNPLAAQKLRDELLLRYPSSPITADVWSTAADALFDKDEFEKAIAIYEKIEKGLSPASIEKLTIARILFNGNGDPQKILSIAENALNKNDRKLAKILFTYLSKSPKAERELPRILAKLGWCIFLEGGEENNKQAEKLWLDVIKRSQANDPWYAEAKWHLVQLASGPERNWKKAILICDSIIKEQALGSIAHEQALFSKAWLLTVHDQGELAVAAFDDLGAAYPEKMLQPPIIQHRDRALKSAEKQAATQP